MLNPIKMTIIKISQPIINKKFNPQALDLASKLAKTISEHLRAYQYSSPCPYDPTEKIVLEAYTPLLTWHLLLVAASIEPDFL